ncbi:hypothetical protein DPV73_17520 [Leptospira mayottensis]|nr:hypothetical protein DPV73_17520 [Leptospira mayottensis]
MISYFEKMEVLCVFDEIVRIFKKSNIYPNLFRIGVSFVESSLLPFLRNVNQPSIGSIALKSSMMMNLVFFLN